MNTARRALSVAGLVLALAAGGALPAWAVFGDSTTVAAGISTGTVQPPTGVDTAGSWCLLVFEAHVSWTLSESPDVSGYLVTGHRGDGETFVMGRTGPQQTSLSATYLTLGHRYTFTVTAETPYGWTATSDHSPTVRC
ncbi:fibronectin type III domain-containing protein [Blastococcus sp. HT6-30]|uniref:fibronectin type III domain-containing protein n=1 Tax=Blastococcus sp. HT6-30 TaxID=3144843 RepID=UPI00321BEF6B